MNKDIVVTEELIQGNPLKIETYLKVEIANQILKMGGNDYENVCENMRIAANIFELLEDNIDKEYVTLRYNPMGAWFLDKEEEEE